MNAIGRVLLMRSVACPEPRRCRRLRRKVEVSAGCFVLALLVHVLWVLSVVTP